MTTETRAEFTLAANAYETALSEWRANTGLLRQTQSTLRAAEFDVETREAELLLSLLPPEKSNAEQRAAQLIIDCAADEEYLRLSVAAEEARSEVAAQTDAAQAARDRMSIEKRRMDFSIGWLSFLAQEGGESQ